MSDLIERLKKIRYRDKFDDLYQPEYIAEAVKELEAKDKIIKEARGLISISVIELEDNYSLIDSLEEFKNKAFEAHPNIDRDIELLTKEEKK